MKCDLGPFWHFLSYFIASWPQRVKTIYFDLNSKFGWLTLDVSDQEKNAALAAVCWLTVGWPEEDTFQNPVISLMGQKKNHFQRTKPTDSLSWPEIDLKNVFLRLFSDTCWVVHTDCESECVFVNGRHLIHSASAPSADSNGTLAWNINTNRTDWPSSLKLLLVDSVICIFSGNSGPAGEKRGGFGYCCLATKILIPFTLASLPSSLPASLITDWVNALTHSLAQRGRHTLTAYIDAVSAAQSSLVWD